MNLTSLGASARPDRTRSVAKIPRNRREGQNPRSPLRRRREAANSRSLEPAAPTRRLKAEFNDWGLRLGSQAGGILAPTPYRSHPSRLAPLGSNCQREEENRSIQRGRSARRSKRVGRIRQPDGTARFHRRKANPQDSPARWNREVPSPQSESTGFASQERGPRMGPCDAAEALAGGQRAARSRRAAPRSHRGCRPDNRADARVRLHVRRCTPRPRVRTEHPTPPPGRGD